MDHFLRVPDDIYRRAAKAAEEDDRSTTKQMINALRRAFPAPTADTVAADGTVTPSRRIRRDMPAKTQGA